MTGTNDAPQLNSIESSALIYTENDGPRTITSSLLLTDFDDVNLESATIQIDQFVLGEDSLDFTAQNGISGHWDSVNGVLTLTGSASLADYQSALRSITYTNSSDHPSTVTRTIRFSVNDGSTDSLVSARDIQLVAVNDEQVLSVNTGITIQENALGNVITSAMLRTDDLDNPNSQLVYTVTNSTSHGTLRLNGVAINNGGTFTQADLDANRVTYDHDGTEQFADAFTFTIDDGLGTSNTSTFAISITPVNDQTPVITSDGGTTIANLNVAENSVHVTTVTATDLDLPSQSLSFSIQGGTDASRFSIDSSTGQLRFLTAPDRENPIDTDGNNTYEVVVQVTDGQLSSTQTIRVTVTDVNEFSISPIADLNAAQNRVAENAAIGTSVGISASAYDSDATTNTVTYSLSNNPNGLFQIDAITGEVTTAVVLDRETLGASHSITVQAQSSDGSIVTRTFVIDLDDQNEFGLSSITDSNSASNFVNENAAIGTAVGITALATDADATNNLVTYSLDDSANGRFSIGSTDGIVRVAGAIDFEQAGSYQITVKAMSLDGSTSTVTYTIVIGDRNDNAPTVGAGQVLSIAENSIVGSSLGTVNASDVDSVGSLQSWQIVTDSSAGGFSINATTGEITTVNSFNFEAASSYTLVVRVNDGANWSANQTVTIHILDVNEAPVAAADSFTIRTDQIVSVSAAGLVGNDFDVDGDTLFPVLVTGAANGTVTIGVNGQLTYTPRPGFFGTDTFQYVASDGQLTSNVVTVTIEVQVAASGNTGSGGSGSSGSNTNNNSNNDSGDNTDSNQGDDNSDPSDTSSGPANVSGPSESQSNSDDNLGSPTHAHQSGTLRHVPGSLNHDSYESVQLMTASQQQSFLSFERQLQGLGNQAISERTESLLLQRNLMADLNQSIVWNHWDSLKTETEQAPTFGNILVGSAGVTAGLFSVGYVMFALRGGVLIASAYSSIPAWRMLDPASLLTQSRTRSASTEGDAVEDLMDV